MQPPAVDAHSATVYQVWENGSWLHPHVPALSSQQSLKVQPISFRSPVLKPSLESLCCEVRPSQLAALYLSLISDMAATFTNCRQPTWPPVPSRPPLELAWVCEAKRTPAKLKATLRRLAKPHFAGFPLGCSESNRYKQRSNKSAVSLPPRV